MVKKPQSREVPKRRSHAGKRATKAAGVKSNSRVVQQTPERGDEIGQIATELTDRAARVGLDFMQQGANRVQRVLQSGNELVAQVTAQSADQFGRAFGFTGETGRKAAQDSSGDVNAVFRSGTVLADVTTSMAREWFNFVHDRMERNLARVQSLMNCRTLQEFGAIQSKMLREDIEGMVECTRKIASHSTRVTAAAQRERGAS